MRIWVANVNTSRPVLASQGKNLEESFRVGLVICVQFLMCVAN